VVVVVDVFVDLNVVTDDTVVEVVVGLRPGLGALVAGSIDLAADKCFAVLVVQLVVAAAVVVLQLVVHLVVHLKDVTVGTLVAVFFGLITSLGTLGAPRLSAVVVAVATEVVGLIVVNADTVLAAVVDQIVGLAALVTVNIDLFADKSFVVVVVLVVAAVVVVDSSAVSAYIVM